MVWQVGTGTDDTNRRLSDGAWDLAANTCYAGGHNTLWQFGCGLRFTNITIPHGSTILSAYLTMRICDPRAGTIVRTRISAEDVDDAPTFDDDAAAFDARWANRTIARVDWDGLAGWALDTDHDSPDISTVIQEIIDRPGWAEGDIVIFWEDFEDRSTHNSSAFRSMYSYDNNPTYAPKLTITFTQAPAATTQPVTDINQTTATGNGTTVRIGLENADKRGVCWNITGNPTVADSKSEETGSFGIGAFTRPMTGLTPGLWYYVRAYAHNSEGYGYGEQVSFLAKSDALNWISEVALPFTPTGQIYFSPIIGDEVYVIDQDLQFYKYNLATRGWTELASPTYGSDANSRTRFYRTLAISPDGTKLACCSEGKWSTYIGSADYKTGGGRRVEIYDIAANTWSASQQTDFLIDAAYAFTRSLVWEDNDILWVWCIKHKRTATGWGIKCVKYTISTDTWTPFASSFQDTATGANGNNCGYGGCAIKADKSVVYSGGTALANYTCKKYTIATDTYSGLTHLLTNRFCHTYDRDKIWYYKAASDCRQGYFDVSDDSVHDDQFPENTERSAGYGKYGGIADNLTIIITHARAAAPELMSETTIFNPTVVTDPATEVT